MGVRPPYGIVVCGDDSRHKVENSDALRAWVLEVAGQIWAARVKVADPIPVTPKPRQGARGGDTVYKAILLKRLQRNDNSLSPELQGRTFPPLPGQ